MKTEQAQPINTVIYEGREYDVTTVKITRNVWIAKCKVMHKGHPFDIQQKGVNEVDAIQKLVAFLKT